MQKIELEEAKTCWMDLISTALKGEEIIFLQDRQAVLKLVRVEDSKFYRQPGSAKGMIRMSEDFDAPLEDFQEYMS